MEAIEEEYGYAYAAGYYGSILTQMIMGEKTQLEALEQLTAFYNGIQEEKNV